MTKHKTRIEEDRYRVVCLQCTWFHYDVKADKDDLRSFGNRHTQNARQAQEEDQ